jgi:lysophospholipase L1-like esterase
MNGRPKRIGHHRLPQGLFLSGLFILFIFTVQRDEQMTAHRLLCLGDSYTIGESLPYRDNFPSQTVSILNGQGLEWEAPEIIARTGWTTDELQSAIDRHQFQDGSDFVTLLIGVNDQYRGRLVAEYAPAFTSLLKLAVHLAFDKADHVIVLSIPDWGVTPFAHNRNRPAVAKDIDEYNAVNRAIALEFGVHYLDITAGTREAAGDPSLVAADGLHPSQKEYARWAKQLSGLIQSMMK